VREQEEDDYGQDVSVFPLAIPLLAGPGAITTVLLYTGERSPAELGIFVGVLLFVLILTLLSLLLAPRIMGLFGETGANVLSRVLGVLLAALAVQFVLDGVNSSLA
jgi:multiple antibiotic resistance protein